MNRMMPATVPPKRCFSAVLYGAATPTARGQLRSRAETDSRSELQSWAGCRIHGYPGADPVEYLAPLCAEHDGQCEAGDKAKNGAHGRPGQPCRQQGEPPRSVSEVSIKLSVLRCMERLLGKGRAERRGSFPPKRSALPAPPSPPETSVIDP